MSWSISKSGASDWVAGEIEKQFEEMTTPCPEPEESLKQQARALISTALAANDPVRSVNVQAYGSQSQWTTDDAAHVSNSLTIIIA